MAPPSRPSKAACTNACALNNTAVAMMLRGEHQCAASVFKSSLKIMRTVCRSQQNMQALERYAQEQVVQASTRLSKMSVPNADKDPQEPPQEEARPSQTLVAVEANDFHALKEMASTDTEQRQLCAILIREEPDQDDGPESSVSATLTVARECGIMLFNLGLACYLTHQENHQQAQTPQPLDAATMVLRSLTLTHTTFSQILLQYNHHKDTVVNNREDCYLETVLLSLLILSTSSHIFGEFDEYDEHARESQDAFQALKLLVQEDHFMDCLLAHDANAAAAA